MPDRSEAMKWISGGSDRLPGSGRVHKQVNFSNWLR
jgi:hypothetical protein